MNNSGDAAEQVVRLSLEGTEVALKLTGSAAKNIAAALYAVLKNRDKNKIKGRQRLTAMLKSGKELKVFTISEEHLKQFATEAKRYGVVYCALRGKEKSADGMVDVMVRAEDASKINRIVERFHLANELTCQVRTGLPGDLLQFVQHLHCFRVNPDNAVGALILGLDFYTCQNKSSFVVM